MILGGINPPIVVEASFDLDESVSLKTFEALNGSLEIAKMLLEYKAGSNGKAFFTIGSCGSQNSRSFHALLKKFARPFAKVCEFVEVFVLAGCFQNILEIGFRLVGFNDVVLCKNP